MSNMFERHLSAMPPRKRRGIIARDRRLAAIHEAGHAVIARRHGVPVFDAAIWPTETDDAYEKAWVGNIRFFGNVAPAKARLVGVAGAVAEECWLHRNDRDDPWGRDYILSEEPWEDPNAMSATDWDFTGTRPAEPDSRFMRAVERVYADMMGSLWPEVCNVARDLIVEARAVWHEAA